VPRAGIDLLAEAGPAPGATRFAPDSPLEESGFKLLVPLCGASPAEEKRLVCTSRGSSRLDLHDPRGRPTAELADRHQRPGVSLNSFAPGGVGTSKTLSVTETNE
jgi:hypothetical protein